MYWGLFCIPIFTTQGDGFEWLEEHIEVGCNALVVWVGRSILGISDPISTEQTGSGDKTADWVLLLCIAVIALIASLAWSLLDRRRDRDPQLRAALRVIVR